MPSRSLLRRVLGRPPHPRRLAVERLESRCCLAVGVHTDAEQLLVELLNRARSNPAAEAARYGIDLNAGLAPGTISPAPKQPLAPHAALIAAAQLHSQDMLDRDFFAHNNPDGQTPWARMQAAGYSFTTAGENIYQAWGSGSFTPTPNSKAAEAHEVWFRSPGHRTNMLGASFLEVGVGARGSETNSGGVSSGEVMITQNFGSRAGPALITGVVFTDALVPDSFYSLGEGVGGVTITAVAANQTAYSVQSTPAGGYALEVPPGTYTVTAQGAAISGGLLSVSGVVVAGENRKVDFNVALKPEISVELDGGNIPDGTAAAVDFGIAGQGRPGARRTFTVHNTGGQELTLEALVLPAGFSLIAGPPSAIAAGDSATFTLELNTATSGVKAGLVRFGNNDADENPFEFPVTGIVAAPPVITDIADLGIDEDGATGPLAFTIGSTHFGAGALAVEAASSNSQLVPALGLSLGGTGANRTLSATPVANQFGSTTITITVTDSLGGVVSDSFVLTVRPLNDPPTLAPIRDPFLLPGQSHSMPLSLADIDSPVEQISVTASSANGSLLPPSGLTVSGTGETRTLAIQPASGQVGTAEIDLRVDDGQSVVQVVFTVWVLENQFPWHHAARPLDVTDSSLTGPPDGKVAPGDALAIINHINMHGAGPIRASLRVLGPPYLDTAHSLGSLTGDNFVTPADSLAVINWINSHGSQTAGPEGEAASGPASGSGWDDALESLVMDLAAAPGQPKRRRV